MDLATVVQMPNMEGNRMIMILAPKARRDGGGGGTCFDFMTREDTNRDQNDH